MIRVVRCTLERVILALKDNTTHMTYLNISVSKCVYIFEVKRPANAKVLFFLDTEAKKKSHTPTVNVQIRGSSTYVGTYNNLHISTYVT